MSIFGRNQHFSSCSFETHKYKEAGVKVEGRGQLPVVVYQAGEDSKEQKHRVCLWGSSKSKRAPGHWVGPRETLQPDGEPSAGLGAHYYSHHLQTHFGRSISSEPES